MKNRDGLCLVSSTGAVSALTHELRALVTPSIKSVVSEFKEICPIVRQRKREIKKWIERKRESD